MSTILDTGIKNARNVLRYTSGEGSLKALPSIIAERRQKQNQPVVYFIDEFFQDKTTILNRLGCEKSDVQVFVSTVDEPSTDYIDTQLEKLNLKGITQPAAIIGMGGGITLDVAKAISNLLTNGGKSEQYQGWDLVKKPGIYKVAIPTLSGTGAEATRTCVLTNKKTGLKLGMNSDFTVYDQLILDSTLTKTVPRNQYFYTGMDAYIHCIESLNGSYRNAIGDAYSEQTISLCRNVFMDNDMKSDGNRSKIMVASYLGGCAIATSYVGVVHPFSAGLSIVLGTHHCVANCITMRAMKEFYPDEYKEFWQMVKEQEIEIPEGVCRNLSDDQYDKLYTSTVIHEKPLTNALGEKFKEILTKEKVIEIFRMM
jgi:3-deoxy-alpha-D-manno-octulosonate 8-oxidase